MSLVFSPVPCLENKLLSRKGITDGICRLTTWETYKGGVVTPAMVTLKVDAPWIVLLTVNF